MGQSSNRLSGTNGRGTAKVPHASSAAAEAELVAKAASAADMIKPATEVAGPAQLADGVIAASERSPRERLRGCQVIRRRAGEVVPFDENKIFGAILKAFVANAEQPAAGDDPQVREEVAKVVDMVCSALSQQPLSGTSLQIEQIQDQVELALMRSEHFAVAKAFVLYRQDRQRVRAERAGELMPDQIGMVRADGTRAMIDPLALQERIAAACNGLSSKLDRELLFSRIVSALYDGITADKVHHAMVLEASTLSEQEPDYLFVAARLLLDALREEVLGHETAQTRMVALYPQHFANMIRTGVAEGLLDRRMASAFDIDRLGKALDGARDLQFSYLGLQTLYDRYFLKVRGRRIELPQSMLMRVAMGLAINEDNPTKRAIEFYGLMSSFRMMSSSPTLFNAGTVRPQLSSCYLSTVDDDLDGIYTAIKDNALLAKYAGGLGNDWTPVRSHGSFITGTGGNSQGVVPFLRVVNDTAVAVNQGGKRKGAVCCYLETWHRDIRDFIELRKNTGDERRRTHDMNTAIWIPDLFLKRVRADGDWTLFSPSDAPDLHDLYGAAFERSYEEYERRFEAGEIDGERISALQLWQDAVKMLFQTGHPWMTFKDACNVRSPQQHAGVVHSSNLCTEITLNTSADEIAVCNLASVNLHVHMRDGKLDSDLLRETASVAMRMLDNVIDINYYSVDKAKNSNLKHRPVGLGMMGFQDCLYEMGITYNSQEALDFADESAEQLAYCAYWASSDLAAERGRYASYEGSLWSKGILPPDTLRMLAKERSPEWEAPADETEAIDTPYLQADLSRKLDWGKLRAKIKADGMRNSNCVAIAPTATIANIVGVTSSIEPTFQNLYAKSNLSGEFKIVNARLVRELQKLGLWDSMMLSDIKSGDGEIDGIERIPQELRESYPTAFNIEPKWLIKAAARRQKWIDQAQSLNLYTREKRGRKVSEMYMLAWEHGLKTTYYLRSTQASSTEKYSTETTGNLNAVDVPTSAARACRIDEPDCESCAG